MKKSGIIIIGIILVLLLLLILFKNIKLDLSKKDIIPLEQIKEELVNTKKIYLCKNYDGLEVKCNGDKLERIIDDETTVKEFIETTLALPEYNGDVTTEKIGTTLCFVDEKESVIATAGFSLNYILRKGDSEYYLTIQNDANHLRELIGLKIIEDD